MKVTSSFGKRPIKVVEQVVCSTDDIEAFKIQARIEEIENFEWNDPHMYVHTRLATLKAQLAALRGETV